MITNYWYSVFVVNQFTDDHFAMFHLLGKPNEVL